MTQTHQKCRPLSEQKVCYDGVSVSYVYSSALILYNSIGLCTNAESGA